VHIKASVVVDGLRSLQMKSGRRCCLHMQGSRQRIRLLTPARLFLLITV